MCSPLILYMKCGFYHDIVFLPYVFVYVQQYYLSIKDITKIVETYIQRHQFYLLPWLYDIYITNKVDLYLRITLRSLAWAYMNENITWRQWGLNKYLELCTEVTILTCYISNCFLDGIFGVISTFWIKMNLSSNFRTIFCLMMITRSSILCSRGWGARYPV